MIVMNNLTLEDSTFQGNDFSKLVGVRLMNFDTLIMNRVKFIDNVVMDY